MIRLHAPSRTLAVGQEVALDGARHHYLSHVLRARPGTAVALFSGDGSEFHAEVVAVSRNATRLVVRKEEAGLPPSPTHVILLQPLLKGGRLEWVVQKAVELGVAAVTLVDVERADVRWGDKAERRRERIAAVAEEAAEQCGRAEVPPIDGPRTLPAALERLPADAVRLVFWEEARDASLQRALSAARGATKFALLFGPEGGLTAAEVERAEAAGFQRAGLGPRILRAETAPIAALAIVQYVLGDLA